MCKKLICLTSFVLVVVLAGFAQAEAYVIGDFEGDLGTLTAWGDAPEGVSFAIGNTAATLGESNLELTHPGGGYYILGFRPEVVDLTTATTLSMDITLLVENFADAGNWTQVDKIAVNSDLGWIEIANPVAINRDNGEASKKDWGPWDGDQRKTISWDLTTQDWTGITDSGWLQIAISVQANAPGGLFLIDNIRINGVEPPVPPIEVATVEELEAAAAVAVAGDTILLAEGTYEITSQIEIKDGVTYQGAGSELTIIDCNNVTRAFAAWGDRGAVDGQVEINDANEVVNVQNTTGPTGWVIDGLSIQNAVSDANNRQDILGAARNLLNNYVADTPYTLATAQAQAGSITDNPGWFDILSGGADDNLTDAELQTYLDNTPPGSEGHLVVNGDKDDDGGAVNLMNGAAGTIRNCVFSNSLADDDGGAVIVDGQGLALTIENCEFNSCSALGDDAGAVFMSGNASTYIVTDTSFTNCTADNDGGAVKADGSDSSIAFSNCTFSNISANDDGGAIALSAGGQAVFIENCEFNSCSNNAGDDGGAVYMSSQGSTYTFTDTTFTDCISDDDAGVAYCSGSNSTFAFSNCTFDRNTCGDEGGALKIDSPGSTVTFTDTTIIDNYAGDDAGGMRINGDDATYVFTGCTFIGNTCNDDWAALQYKTDRAELTMTNCSFISNGLDADGAVVGDDSVLGFDDDDAGPSTFSNCLIAYNACNDDWVMELKAAFSLLNCTFIGNASNDVSKSMIGVRGQAWDSTGDETDDVVTDDSIISNCLFINNTTQKSVIGDTRNDVFAPTVINCLFYGNLDDGEPAANTDDNSLEVGTIDVSAVTDAAQIVVDPAGDYHPAVGSPAVDASDPAMATEADIEGTAAVGVRDVGAYESAD